MVHTLQQQQNNRASTSIGVQSQSSSFMRGICQYMYYYMSIMATLLTGIPSLIYFVQYYLTLRGYIPIDVSTTSYSDAQMIMSTQGIWARSTLSHSNAITIGVLSQHLIGLSELHRVAWEVSPTTSVGIIHPIWGTVRMRDHEGGEYISYEDAPTR